MTKVPHGKSVDLKSLIIIIIIIIIIAAPITKI